jgi:hypothetical protein|tara:strand:+ start:148 stop:906 length:759 start_codon:yes stop_codon:yes gene_type:complete
VKPLLNYINKYKNKHKIAVIWGSGVSVNSLSPKAHAPFLNFAVNASIMLFPFWKSGGEKNRVFMAIDTDASHWSWFHDATTARCYRLLRRYAFDRHETKKTYFSNAVYNIPNSFYFDMRKSNEALVDLKATNTVPHASVIPMAIDVALKLGVKLIALAGVEHQAVAGKTHFWQEWSADKRPIQSTKRGRIETPKDLSNQKRVWNKNKNVFNKLFQASHSNGVKIVRLTEKSSLSLIPYMKESEFLKYAKKFR